MWLRRGSRTDLIFVISKQGKEFALKANVLFVFLIAASLKKRTAAGMFWTITIILYQDTFSGIFFSLLVLASQNYI